MILAKLAWQDSQEGQAGDWLSRHRGCSHALAWRDSHYNRPMGACERWGPRSKLKQEGLKKPDIEIISDV